MKLLQKRLIEVEKKLEKLRGCSPLTHGWQTQRYSRADKNWDYYAKLRIELLELIEGEKQKFKNESMASVYYCLSCCAMEEIECCCNENEE